MAELLQSLAGGDAGIVPALFLHRCARLVESLPALPHNLRRPEAVFMVDAAEDGVDGDHAAGVLRHLVATKAREVRVRK